MAHQPLYRTIEQLAQSKRANFNNTLKPFGDIDAANIVNVTMRSLMLREAMVQILILENIVEWMKDPNQKKTNSEIRAMFETACESLAHDQPYLGASIIKMRRIMLFEIWGTTI